MAQVALDPPANHSQKLACTLDGAALCGFFVFQTSPTQFDTFVIHLQENSMVKDFAALNALKRNRFLQEKQE